jgi:6-pyruvoyltetrahydropterin/6-carboxytetrahydropterin synthase
MVTCTKTYSDIPFAHRQHRHDGHCAQIHGHNWAFSFTFGARQLDENGFVIDFGRLGFVRDWLRETFDHACVFNRDDPLREALVAAAPQAFRVVVVESCSCEGLAEHVFHAVDTLVRERTAGRVHLEAVEVAEDGRNRAAFRP